VATSGIAGQHSPNGESDEGDRHHNECTCFNTLEGPESTIWLVREARSTKIPTRPTSDQEINYQGMS